MRWFVLHFLLFWVQNLGTGCSQARAGVSKTPIQSPQLCLPPAPHSLHFVDSDRQRLLHQGELLGFHRFNNGL